MGANFIGVARCLCRYIVNLRVLVGLCGLLFVLPVSKIKNCWCYCNFTFLVWPTVLLSLSVSFPKKGRERRLCFLRHRCPSGGGGGDVEQQHVGRGIALEVRRGQEKGMHVCAYIRAGAGGQAGVVK